MQARAHFSKRKEFFEVKNLDNRKKSIIFAEDLKKLQIRQTWRMRQVLFLPLSFRRRQLIDPQTTN